MNSADLFDVLPCGLHNLLLDHSTFDEPSLAVYLRKANPTLRNLKICDSNFDHHSNYQNFEELHNLEEISIKLPPPQVLKIHLEQNAQSLERVKLTFHDQKYGGWRLHENNFKLLGRLSNLKELTIVEKFIAPKSKETDDIHLLVDVLRSVGPNLRKLSLAGMCNGVRELLNLESLKDLQELKIEPYWDFDQVRSMLRHLTGLITLEFRESYDGMDNKVDQESGLLPLIESLPNLKELKYPF